MLQFYLSMLSSDSEKSLVEYLYKEYRQLMYKTAYSVLHNKERAEDAVQDAFLRVIDNIEKFSGYSRRENISYLVIIVRGIALNMLSDTNKVTELDEAFPDSADLEEAVISDLMRDEIMGNINELSPALRDIAVLFFVQNRSAGEISELLDININTVYSAISRARAILARKTKEGDR